MNSLKLVYVMGSSRDGPLKIGFAKDPETRARDLQTGAPRALHVYWQFPVTEPERWERLIHDALAPSRLKGEWFDIPVERAIAALWAASLAYNQENAWPAVDLVLDWLRHLGAR
jgi:hypothetical protein